MSLCQCLSLSTGRVNLVENSTSFWRGLQWYWSPRIGLLEVNKWQNKILCKMKLWRKRKENYLRRLIRSHIFLGRIQPILTLRPWRQGGIKQIFIIKFFWWSGLKVRTYKNSYGCCSHWPPFDVDFGCQLQENPKSLFFDDARQENSHV